MAENHIGSDQSITSALYGLYIRVDSRVIKHFIDNIKSKEKNDVCIDFDGDMKKFTLQEFKELLFPTCKRALQALLIAGTAGRDAVLDGFKNITIREGYRNYTPGPVMIGCHILSWAVLKEITRVEWKLLKDVTEPEMLADGFNSLDDVLVGLRRFYPEIGLDSSITVIEWK